MTTPPTDPNVPTNVTPVKAAKPGIPRAALLGGTVVLLGGIAAAAFFLMQNKGDEAPVDTAPPPPPVTQGGVPPTTMPKPAASATPDAVAKAKQQARAAMNDNVDLRTSFDNVPITMGGTGARIFPDTPGTAPTPAPGASPVAIGGKDFLPIKQGTLPSATRPDPFVSRLVVPILREYAYTLAIPIRLAPPPKPVIPPASQVPPELRLGPLVFPGRVAGFLEYGGVSAILETGVGTGAFDIVQPGSQVPSGVPGVPPLTVESISSSELVLRSEDGRTAKVPLSGVPGGLNIPGGQGGPEGPGVPGAPPGFGGRGGDPRGGPAGVQ